MTGFHKEATDTPRIKCRQIAGDHTFMNIAQRIEARWGMKLPDEYLLLSQTGALDFESPNYLLLTQIKEWYIPAKVEGQIVPEYWKPTFVPFAASPMADRLCWVNSWRSPEGIGTAFCFRSSSTAFGYAPNFAGAVYRALLEEFTGSALTAIVNPDELKERFKAYVELVSPILMPAWAETLRGITERKIEVADDMAFLLREAEANQIIERYLAFAELNKEVEYTH